MMSGESTAHSGPSIDPRKRETNSRRTTARISSLCCQARVKGSTSWGGTENDDSLTFLSSGGRHRPAWGRLCQWRRESTPERRLAYSTVTLFARLRG